MFKLLLIKAILFSNTSDCSGLKMNRSPLKLRKWQESVYRQNWVYDEVGRSLSSGWRITWIWNMDWIDHFRFRSIHSGWVSGFNMNIKITQCIPLVMSIAQAGGSWWMVHGNLYISGAGIGNLTPRRSRGGCGGGGGGGGEQVALKSLAVSVWVNLSINQICQGPQFCSVKYFKFTLKQFTEMTEIFIFPFIFNNELYNLTSKNTCLNVWYKGSLQQSFPWLFLSHTPIIQ